MTNELLSVVGCLLSDFVLVFVFSFASVFVFSFVFLVASVFLWVCPLLSPNEEGLGRRRMTNELMQIL